MMLFALVCLLNWTQLSVLLTWSDLTRFLLEWKRDPLPAAYLAGILSLTTLFVGAPFVEEFLRTSRKRMHADS